MAAGLRRRLLIERYWRTDTDQAIYVPSVVVGWSPLPSADSFRAKFPITQNALEDSLRTNSFDITGRSRCFGRLVLAWLLEEDGPYI